MSSSSSSNNSTSFAVVTLSSFPNPSPSPSSIIRTITSSLTITTTSSRTQKTRVGRTMTLLATLFLIQRSTSATTTPLASAFIASPKWHPYSSLSSSRFVRPNLQFRSMSTDNHPNHNRSSTTTTTMAMTMTMERLLGKNLVSLQDCLDVHHHQSNSDIPTAEGPIFIDGSWHLTPERNGRDEFQKGPRIRGAKFFDIDDVAAPRGSTLNPKGLPHMMPTKELFATTMNQLNIQNTNHLIVYATNDCPFASRAFFTLRAMGHDPNRVHLMQGSLQDWIDAGGEIDVHVEDTSSEQPQPPQEQQTLDGNESYVSKDATQTVDMDTVLSVVNANQVAKDAADSIIIDARGEARFWARAPEPREGVRGGHMPGAYNVPFTSLLEPNHPSKFRNVEELRGVFRDGGIRLEEWTGVNHDENDDEEETNRRKIICSCGSGVTACVVALALEECGVHPKDIYVYDGSWLEWGSDPDVPIVSS